MNRQHVIDNDLVARYVRNELDDDERKDFEIFYLDDQDTLDELEVYASIKKHVADDVSAQNIEVAQERASVDKANADKAEIVPLPKRGVWFLPTALAATLMVGIGIGATLPSDPATTPLLLQSAALVNVEITRGSNGPVIDVPGGSDSVMVRVAVGGGESAYRLSFTDPRGAKLVSEPLVPDSYGDIAVMMQPSLLGIGNFELIAIGEDSGQTVLSATLRFSPTDQSHRPPT